MPRIKKRAPRAGDVPEKARGLLDLPNVGPATALDLVRLGVYRAKDLARKNPDRMYERLCAIDGVRHDPCLLDVFTSLVAYSNGAPARPWWAYSAERKARRPSPARPSDRPRPRSR